MPLQSKGLSHPLNLKNRLTKSPFFLLILVFSILVTLVASIWLFIGKQNEIYQRLESQKLSELKGLENQIKTLRTQATLYEEYSERHSALIQEGIVRQQDRVLWVDAMVKLQHTLVMPTFNFKFSPQTVLSDEHLRTIKLNKPVFNFSRLELKMGLQHEADLLTFLEAFNKYVTPLYLLERCQAEAQSNLFENREQIEFDPKRANIKVDCVLIVFHPHEALKI